MMPVIISIFFCFISFLISSIAGFAGAAFAVPLTATVLGLMNARAAVNIISIAFNLTISIQQRAKIKIKEIIPILLLVFVGMGFGYIMNSYISSEKLLLRILGIFIFVIAFFRFFVNKEIKLNKWQSVLIIFVSGIVNYLFLCGGIILVLYMSGKYRDKDTFRGSNGVIFLSQSLLMFVIQYSQNMYTKESYMVGLLGIIPVIIATLIGKIIVKKISQEQFEKITYLLLMCMAVLIIV